MKSATFCLIALSLAYSSPSRGVGLSEKEIDRSVAGEVEAIVCQSVRDGVPTGIVVHYRNRSTKKTYRLDFPDADGGIGVNLRGKGIYREFPEYGPGIWHGASTSVTIPPAGSISTFLPLSQFEDFVSIYGYGEWKMTITPFCSVQAEPLNAMPADVSTGFFGFSQDTLLNITAAGTAAYPEPYFEKHPRFVELEKSGLALIGQQTTADLALSVYCRNNAGHADELVVSIANKGYNSIELTAPGSGPVIEVITRGGRTVSLRLAGQEPASGILVSTRLEWEREASIAIPLQYFAAEGMPGEADGFLKSIRLSYTVKRSRSSRAGARLQRPN